MEANTILIVDDDAGLSELLSEKAEDSGYYTLNVHNAMNALEWLKEHSPFLMILDYSLPDMNGKELITELIGKGINIPPFIVTTGQGDERIAVEMMKLGARDYIIKDNHFLDLIPLVINNVGFAIKNENKLRLAEQALIDSSQFNSQIIKSAQEGIVVFNRDLKYVAWNPFMENLTGIPASDVLGKYPCELFPFLEESGIIENIKKALQGEVIHETDLHFDIPATGKSGWTSEKTAPLYNICNEITGAIVTVRDNTERKLVEEKLKESEEKYRCIFANNPQPMWIYDLETLAFLEVNDAAIKHYGYSREEFLMMNLKDIRPAEDIPLLIENIQRGKFSKGITDVWRHIKKNGDLIFVEITSQSMLFKGRNARHILVNDITDRKLAEKQLRLLSKAIEQSPVTVVITDKKGNIEYTNPKFTQTTGYTLEEVKGKNPRFLKSGHHPREYYENLWNTILAGQEWSGEFHNKKKNGESYWDWAVISSIVNNKGEIDYFLAVKEDITERKKLFEELIQAKEKAEESQHNLRLKNEELSERNTFIQTILDHLPIGLALNTINEGIAMYMNKKFQEIYGWTSDEITSIASFFEKVYPDKEYRELLIESVMADINSGDPQRMHWEDLYVTRKDGSKRVINAVNIPLVEQNMMVSTAIDITSLHYIQNDLLNAKEKAEESEFRLIEAQKTAHIGHWNWNFKKKQLTWSDEIFNIFGLSKESFDVTADSFESFIHPDDLDKFKQKREECLMKGEEINIDHRIVRTNGEIRFVQERSKILRDENNQPINVFGTVQDITELKLIEIDLVKAKEHAEESDRLKSAFLANMSHEIRTPMNSILGFAELLKEPDLDDRQRKEFFSIIEQSGERMLNTINNIVDISKIEAGQMTISTSETCVIDITTNIQNLISREVAQKGLQFYCKTNEPIVINTDKDKLNHILLNLVKNAIKFTDTGLIEIGYGSSGMLTRDLMKERESDKLLFYVKDTGIGIRPEQKEFIFERFRQGSESLNKKYEGAGLGLSISKAYVEMLGGRIWVESEEGIGATFYFTLPYNDKAEFLKNNLPAVSCEGEEKPAKLKILIAEDDQGSSKFIKLALKSVCNEMISAQNGEEAVEACRMHPDIDLILLDIQMPEMSGYEAIRLIRQFNSEVVIIAQTAYAMAGDHEKVMAAGFNDYITKPFNRAKLLKTVKKHFNK